MAENHGTGAELFRNGEAGALSRFLVDVHTELHLPRPWGLLLTGILGLMMMSAAVSGFLMHRHLLADMFLNRPRRSELTVRKDAHAVAGTWGLPFAFLLAFTGCFFSFAGSFGLPAMAMVAFGGDQEAMMRTLLGAPAATTDESRTGANLNLIVEDVRQRSGELPRNLLISHYGKADASVLVTAEPRKTQVQALQFEYDGVTGEFRRERPVVGQHPSLGASLFSLIQPLHFGHFAGLFSKFIWVALGFATCYLITSGFSLWLARRREEPKWRLFARCTYVFSSGLPIAMLAAAAAYFVSGVIGLNPVEVLPPVFIGVATLIIALGVLMKDARQLKGLLVTAAALLCLALPPVRLLTGGPSWSMALSGHNIAVPMIDLLLVLAGTFCIVSLLRDARVRNKTIRLRGELNAAG